MVRIGGFFFFFFFFKVSSDVIRSVKFIRASYGVDNNQRVKWFFFCSSFYDAGVNGAVLLYFTIVQNQI
jgi:hypothetical protein